ncbi:MAG TPA: acyl-CoA desaturase [Gemmatimonadaceae bacterium]|nr:acyl-CoA desaturase [Gemmatimonadaceae bacterium]
MTTKSTRTAPVAHDPLHGAAHDHGDEFHDDIIYPASIPFLLVHLACIAAIWTGVSAKALLLCVTLYVVRMFGVTAGYHRYFSHRSFKTSRVGQFLLAWLAQSSAQRGILWWAATHRHHHKHSDTPEDVHSPRHRGFLYAHVSWVFDKKRDAEQGDYATIPDLTQYPELRWLDRHPYLPAAVLAVACFLALGWQGLVVGFFWSTVLLYHGTFFINSLAHVHGNQRYVTGDDSRNNWWLAVITLGEGWHNNHHAYQRSTRQGFRWYEFDPTFYVLTALSWARVVWELGAPPADVVANERRLGRAVLEKVARQLAASVHVDGIVAHAHEAWANTPTLDELRARAHESRQRAEAFMAELHLPHLPTREELRERAQQMFASTPSMDDVVERARELVLQSVCARLVAVSTRPEPA